MGEYQNWNLIITKAKTTIGPEREELLEKASEMIEKDLILLGVAAVEDKLQKGVCIDISLSFSLCEFMYPHILVHRLINQHINSHSNQFHNQKDMFPTFDGASLKYVSGSRVH